MKNTANFLLAILCCAFLIANAVAFDEIELDNWVPSDFDDFEEQPLVIDPGPPINPDDPIITSGDCSDYIDLTGRLLPLSEFGTTVGASNDYGPFSERPPCWRGTWPDINDPETKNPDLICAGPDVAYKWTAPVSAEYTFSLCGSYFDNGLLLYRFTCPDEPTYPDDFICGGDDTCYLRAKLRYIHLDEGEEILIIVDGYGNNADYFELRIYESEIDDMDWWMDLQIETFHIPGAAACIIKDGQIDWTGAYGLANIEENRPVENTTLFTLASISKTVSVAAVMQLWEDGLLELDNDVNDYLPFSVRNPQFPSVPITIRSLLSHVSSIDDCWNTLWALETHGVDSPIPLGEFLEEYLTPDGIYYDSNCNWRASPAETEYHYSNVGVALAAYVVELLNPDDLSFSDYCRQYIFDPLGMNESAWFLSELNIDNLAMPYDWNGYNQIPYGHFGHPWYPSGTLRSNTPELARHLISFMQYGRIDDIRVLDSTTVDMMTTIQYPNQNSRRGLVWYWTYFGIRPVWGHGGKFPGVRTRMFYSPDENTGVIVLTNGEASYALSAMVAHLFEYAGGPSGIVAGIVTDQDSNPIDNVYAKTIGYTRLDYSNPDGEYTIGGLIDGTYDVRFRHPDYAEITVENVAVALGETTYVNITMQSPCDYVIGDYNGNGDFNVSDIIDSFSKLKTGSPEPGIVCECPAYSGDDWAVAMDVNNSCGFNIADVIAAFSKLKTGEPELEPCEACPPLGG